jgi:hypothetical protein
MWPWVAVYAVRPALPGCNNLSQKGHFGFYSLFAPERMIILRK